MTECICIFSLLNAVLLVNVIPSASISLPTTSPLFSLSLIHPVLSVPIITDSIPGANNVILQQPDTPSEVVLNCTVEAHPTPSLTWTRDDGSPVDQQQGVTRFRQTAFSVLTVPTSELEGRVEFTCQADVVGLTEHTLVVINSYSEPL